jgi:hypothetical protein
MDRHASQNFWSVHWDKMEKMYHITKYRKSCLKYQNIIQIIHQPDGTIFQFIILTFIYSSTCFGPFPAHHQEFNDCRGSLWFYLRIVVTIVLCSWSGRPARPWTQLLIMGGKTPETCWLVNKRQDNKLENCCIWLVIYFNCRIRHRLTKLKI